MPEIGATLREARMRARIDISEIESETKIRAKYLRALENEEWALLPGPAYVRSFLRTYAEALGLDAKMLLEEYKLRYERPSDHDLMPIGAPRRRPAQRGGRPPRRVPRGLLVGLVIAGLVVALWALGRSSGGSSETAATTPTSTVTTTPVPRRSAAASGTARRHKRHKQRVAPNRVRLQVVPVGPGPTFVCLQDAGGRLRIPGVALQPGSPSGTYRSKGFTLRLGNGNVRLRINGRLHPVKDASPLGYVIGRKGTLQRVDLSKTPTCVR